MGLFFNPNESDSTVDEIELIRIPKSSTYNITTLLEVLNRFKSLKGSIEAEIMVEVLKLIQPSNETHIIISYFIAFKIIELYKIKHNIELNDEFQLYLNILSTTETISYPFEISDNSDAWVVEYQQVAKQIHQEWESINQNMRENYAVELKFTTYYQIYQAVRSRILEIPHKLGTENEEGDYSIDITLVPMLDFVNHEHDNNSHFDIDLNSNEDIVLKLNTKKILNFNEKFELTISYSPQDEIVYFYKTYGFKPTKGSYQLMNLNLRRSIKENIKDGELICKWIHVLPEVQIVYNENEIYLNLFNFGQLFNNIKYNLNWENDLLEKFTSYNQIENDEELDKGHLLEFFEHQEKNMDYIHGVGPIGVTNGSSNEILTEYQLPNNISSAHKFIYEFCKIENDVDKSCDSANSTFDIMVQDYETTKKNLFARIIHKYDQGHDFNLPTELSSSDFESYRSKAREIE